MRKMKSKKALLAVSSFLCAACVCGGIGLATAPVVAAPLTTANGLADLDLSQAGTRGVTVGAVNNNYLLVNRAIGGGQVGCNADIVVDVTFLSEANGIKFGMLPTNQKEDIAEGKLTSVSFDGADYNYYYYNGTEYRCAMFLNNAWKTEVTSSIQSKIIGQVQLKVAIGEWSAHSLLLYVPSSNTQMDASVQRDTWITIATEGFGLFQDYTYMQGKTDQGYPFFCMTNVVYNSVSITPGPKSPNNPSFSDNFNDATSFANNFVTNDAFDNAVAGGAITLPQTTASIKNSASTSVYTNHANTNDSIRSVQAFKGAMRVEMSLDSTGPTSMLGFYSLSRQANVMMTTSLLGMKIEKYGESVYREWENENKWATILGQANVATLSGQYKWIMEANDKGDTTIYMQVINQTYGEPLTQQLYEIVTIEGLLADVVKDGGYLVFGGTHSLWGHVTYLDDIKLTDASGNVLLADDFSSNNFNGKGQNLWLLYDSWGLYTLPGESYAAFTGGTAYVNTQNKASEEESLKVTYNAQVLSGAMQYYFGMSAKDTDTATAYVTAENGNLTVTQGSNVATLASGIDFTADTMISLEWNNAQDRLYAYVNGASAGSAAMLVDVTGYMAISAENAKLGYLKAETVAAQSAVQTQAGAYLKANTTLENSGIRFASVVNKAWYDATVADANVTAVSYGMLIVPTDYLSSISEFTLAGLQASGKNYINAVVTNGFTNEATAAEDGYYQYMGGIKNILPANYTRNFSAIGYVTVTYAGVGEKTYYGGYNADDNSRNIYQLAERTYGDRKTEQQGKYTYQLNDGTWAQYSQEVMNVMKAYLDSVVNVTVDGDTVNYVEVNAYYEKAYSVEKVGNVLTITSSVKFDTVIINGVRQKNVSVVQDNGVYTASVEV